MRNPLKNLINKWIKLKLPFKLLTLIILAVLIGLSAYFVTDYYMGGETYSKIGKITTQNNNSVTLVPPSPVPPKYSPVNGIQIENDDYSTVMSRQPIAIVVNNHKDARPQSGLSFADSVLEVLAEGGITRYVAVYHNNYDVSKIGPVRSLRYYMIEFASGYQDAIILHHGWAGFDGAAFEVYNEKTDARKAVSAFGIKDIQTEASTYRDPQKAKTSGYVHALYTDFTRINSEIGRLSKSYGWKLGASELKSLTFKDDNPIETRGLFNSVDIKFMSLSSNDYAAKFVYDKNTNTYLRSVGGQADIDTLTNKQLAPKNVIIEWHNYADARDGHSRIVIDMIGEDKVTVLRDGEVIEGVWRKECRLCRTEYFDQTGKAIELNRGQIWIVNTIKVQNRLISTVTIQ